MSIYETTMMSGVIAALLTDVFLLDALTPLGLPLSVLYIVPLVLTSLLRRREAPYWLTEAFSAATLCGYFLSPSLNNVSSSLPLGNRAMTRFIVVVKEFEQYWNLVSRVTCLNR